MWDQFQCVCRWGFPHQHQLAILWHQLGVKCNSVWHYLPRDNIRSHRLRAQSHKTTTHFRCQSQVPGCCLSDQLVINHINQMFLQTPSLGLINLLTELRETFYLLDCQFIIKRYNSGTATWKRSIGQGMWEGRGVSMSFPGELLSLNLHMFTNLEALQTTSLWFYGGLITQACLITSLTIGDWFNL